MQAIETRLKKVIGQISGIIKMMEKEQDCEKVVIQFLAAKAALDSAFLEVLNQNLTKCVQGKDTKNMKNILKHLSKR